MVPKNLNDFFSIYDTHCQITYKIQISYRGSFTVTSQIIDYIF